VPVPLTQGSVVLANVLDPQRQNPKCRPMVVVSSTDEIKEGIPFVCVAITGTFPKPLPADCVLLPYQREGRAKTGLKKPCVAKCGWPVTVTHADIQKCIGVIPGAELSLILEKVKNQATGQPNP
jgi:hypothetical protein